MADYGKNMTAAKGRKPANKARGSVRSRKDSGRENVDMLFREVAKRMAALAGDEPGTAGETYDYAGTIGLLDQILALEPGNRNALVFRGIMYMGLGASEKALASFNAVLKANPGDSEALNNKAIALYGLGKAREAMEYVDRALEIDKRYADALMNKAVMLHEAGKTEEARKYVARANACDRISP